jgi:hypothetical protein
LAEGKLLKGKELLKGNCQMGIGKEGLIVGWQLSRELLLNDRSAVFVCKSEGGDFKKAKKREHGTM